MSNYYEYREVKVMIVHKLMAMDGWKVYGYTPDESDSMTDYWSPAHWDGIAEKNGYILCVNVYGEAEPQEIRKYNYDNYNPPFCERHRWGYETRLATFAFYFIFLLVLSS